MPRVHCEHCKTGHVKVPFAVQSLTFRCPKCDRLTIAITEWERQRAAQQAAALPAEHPRLPAMVEEVVDSFGGVERIWPLSTTTTPTRNANEPPAPPPPTSFETKLTSPHPCTQCGHGIRAPLGGDRATVVCPACGNRTSLYAVIFRCVCGTVLEAPVRREGQIESCPACAQPTRVPADVLRIAPDEPPLEAWFRFDCMECLHAVAARREDAGAWAVCPHCRGSLEVPHVGEALVDSTVAGEPTPGQVVQAGSLMHCPACAAQISTRAERCHICGRENRPTG